MKLEYISDQPIHIPKLKSKGGTGMTLPLMDYTTGKKSKKQIIEVSENEAGDLMRSWPDCFFVHKDKKEEK